MWWFRYLVLPICALAVAGCGFKPLYEGGKRSQISGQLASVRIAPIADRLGQQLRNELLDRINPFGRPGDPRYALNIKIRESRQELAVRKTELATRANLKIVANFTLKKHGQKPAELLRGTGQATISYNILTANFATMMAEKDARRRAIREISAEITDKLASFFRLSGTAG